MKIDALPQPERVWLASYPPGVPAEVDWRATRSAIKSAAAEVRA